MGYVHINDLLQAVEFSYKERIEKLNNATVNSITNNRESYAEVNKASKYEGVKE